MRIEDVEYAVGDSRLVGHLAIDDEQSGPSRRVGVS
jgi:hypothetical protein